MAFVNYFSSLDKFHIFVIFSSFMVCLLFCFWLLIPFAWGCIVIIIIIVICKVLWRCFTFHKFICFSNSHALIFETNIFLHLLLILKQLFIDYFSILCNCSLHTLCLCICLSVSLSLSTIYHLQFENQWE